MKKQIYLREYRSGKQLILVLLRKAVQMGIKGYEGFRVLNNNTEEDDDWFISERVLKQGLEDGTIVRFQ
jgi:hypothetical protein